MKKQTRGGAPDLRRAAAAMREFLAALGVSAASCGMEETPARTAELYAELFAGLRNDPAALWEETMTEDTAGLVAVRDIPFYSMCEHHLLPFFGTVDIVYRPQDGRVAGFGIFAQLAALYAARPQLQERLTAQIADEIVRGLGAAGVRGSAMLRCLLSSSTAATREEAFLRRYGPVQVQRSGSIPFSARRELPWHNGEHSG